MKKIILTLLLSLFYLVTSYGQEFSNSVKIDVLAGTDLLSYERAFSEHSTGIIGVGVSWFKIGDFEYSIAGGLLQYRYYFREAIQGWHIDGVAQYISGSVESNSLTSEDFGAFGIGLQGGYQWAWSRGFTLDLNTGLSSVNLSFENSNRTSGLNTSIFVINIGVALGYSW